MEQNDRKSLDEDYNLWIFDYKAGDWTLSGSAGISDLAQLELHPDSDFSRLKASVKFGSAALQNDDVTIHVSLSQALLAVASDDFKVVRGELHGRAGDVSVDTSHPSAIRFVGNKGYGSRLHGQPIEGQVVASMIPPRNDAGRAEATFTLSARPSHLKISYEFMSRGTQVDVELRKQAVLDAFFRKTSVKDSPDVVTLAKVSFARTYANAGTIKPLPELLLKTIVERSSKVSEGVLISAVMRPWYELISMIQKDQRLAYEIPPDRWEEIVAGIYVKAGFEEVILTPRSRDFGRDVIATKLGVGTIRVIDQVKAYSPGHLVDAEKVRALVGLLHVDPASKAFLTTTSAFAPGIATDPLITPLLGNRLELIDGPKLFARLAQMSRLQASLRLS